MRILEESFARKYIHIDAVYTYTLPRRTNFQLLHTVNTPEDQYVRFGREEFFTRLYKRLRLVEFLSNDSGLQLFDCYPLLSRLCEIKTVYSRSSAQVVMGAFFSRIAAYITFSIKVLAARWGVYCSGPGLLYKMYGILRGNIRNGFSAPLLRNCGVGWV